MKKIVIAFLIFLVLPIFCTANYTNKAITYNFSGGRFGDNLLVYLNALWLSYNYDIPLVYKPFKYSEELMLSELHSGIDVFEFSKSFKINENNLQRLPFLLKKNRSVLFICPFYVDVHVDWSNQKFLELANKSISPKKHLDLVYPSPLTLNIALHIRDGGGFDAQDLNLQMPLKCPPLNFYVESLLKILKMFEGTPVYCYIFTDALTPYELAAKIKKEIPLDYSINFDCRVVENFHNQNVLEDFFSLFNFDVLICPQSAFSLVPSLIHDYIVVACPDKYSI